jgi:di/tricarboxylate transporter
MEILVVLALTVACVYLLSTEKLPVDLVAVLALVALVVTRIVTVEEGLSGLSNPATVTVAAMFVLSSGLAQTGALNAASTLLARQGRKRPWISTLLLMLVVGFASAFVNNTAVVAVFLPVAIEVARAAKVSPSRLLMPLSFASMFGGVCTLVGTSTNILVSTIAERHGQRPFAMFELAPVGLVTASAGIVYMFAIGMRLIPDRRQGTDLTQTFGMADYLTDVVLREDAKSVGMQANQSALVQELETDILAVFRNGELIERPLDQILLQAGDVLRLRCDSPRIEKLQDRMGVSLVSHLGWRDSDLEGGDMELVEAVVAPNSVLAGATLKSFRFRDTFGAKVLAIRHHGQLARTKLDSTPLRPGDTLLIAVRQHRLEMLARNPAFVMVTPKAAPAFRKKKTLLAFAILAGAIAANALNIVPIVVSAIAGCALMVITGCLKPEEVYRAVDWKVILMLAGLLPLGTAIETTGAARLLSDFVVAVFGYFGPWALLAALYLCTSIFTEVMSNAATAVLLAPIAIGAAASLGVDSRPFLVAVAFAASSSFMTPVGYQTNTLIYGPGAYRFSDFVRVGTPLNVLFWILATLLIPQFWPFRP